MGAMLIIACAVFLFLLFWLLRKRAVNAYRVGVPFDKPSQGVVPLHKDVTLWVIIAVGVVATIFSFVWGMTR